MAITKALPHADVTRNFVESSTSTNGTWAASASLVDWRYRRRSAIGSVETARTSPPESVSVGVWIVGTAVPIAGVAPLSSAVMSPLAPTKGTAPACAVTLKRYAPGAGMSMLATHEASSSPGGMTPMAATGAPTAVPSSVVNWTVTLADVSSSRPPGPVRLRITGLFVPAQTDDDTTSASSARADGGCVADGADAGATGEVAAGCVPATSRMTAVMALEPVPYGKWARRPPSASTR